MTENHYRFESFLPRVNADKLKSMVRMWGGTSKLRKDECIGLITAGLKDPAKVRAALRTLAPWEQNALAILKTFGNQIRSDMLIVSIRATAVKLPPRIENSRWGRERALINALFRRGLVLSGEGSPGYFSGYGSNTVFTDERLTAEAGPLEVYPFDIDPIPAPKHSIYRRPPTVALDVIGLLQAISDLGGLGLTKTGNLRVAVLKKLRKTMKWPEKGIQIDGIFFPDPVVAWVNAFHRSDLFAQGEGVLTLRESPEQFASRSYSEQVRCLLDGFSRSEMWSEIALTPTYARFQNPSYKGRQALLIGLQNLPLDSGGFFSIDDFEASLFDRIGEHFSLGYLPNRPYAFRDQTAAQKKQELTEWRTKLRQNWLSQERPWMIAALKTWVYFLGIVELDLDGDSLIGFRLTQLGQDVLHPHLTAKPEDSTANLGSEIAIPAWVVQPNFDVIAYLEHISATQLAFLERFAEREKANQHTATFRLTRNSVYRGLESGASLDRLLQGLEQGANAEVPQNVLTEIHEWAFLREQITLRHRAKLLEFPDAQSLATACQDGLQGRVIGDRFLLLGGNLSKSKITNFQRTNYALALPACLNITEQGQIQIRPNSHDLWISAQLDQWAERDVDSWQLTAASVADAVQSGKKLTDFLNLLSARLTKPLPKFTHLALWAWAGETRNAELGQEIILRCQNDEVFQALVSSQQLRPFLKGVIAHNTLLVNKDDIVQVAALLQWAGIVISEHFEVDAL
jgi:hypothetical protein